MKIMNNRWHWIVAQLSGRLWFWAALYAVGGIATALVAAWITPLIPDSFSAKIGADAVDDVLTILASSMLAVATFSLSTMVSAFMASINSTTPRAAQLLVEDKKSQNAIASFIGAFLYSLVGIIALRTGIYGASGRIVLFAMTIIVVLTVVALLLRWLDYLSRLGRVDEILDRVEKIAVEALTAEFTSPLSDPHFSLAKGYSINAGDIGYIQFTDVSRLSEIARNASGSVTVLRRSGAFVDVRDVIAAISWSPDAHEVAELKACFVIGPNRSITQDPRYGVILLAEIASRALSPGINDPGTAIEVIARIVRVLGHSEAANSQREEGQLPQCVQLPALSLNDLFDDAFTPISRDGAASLEVSIKLQKALTILARREIYRPMARRHAELALTRSKAKLSQPEDIATLEKSAVLLMPAGQDQPDG
ncbi:DUF2254 domain-containing protein [Alsobacter sp. SYSU M60028]|uniref:DUF2254 domain-containing protein n=1 Tax=Alsobacter ponti TaxID=2962936 RepID=A0ABT1LGR0_9HYPH|nr:DUF2254 domain-containing protein [Alsobacter ponti]MCP8939438.1 DUF2254 domain-containing protein [Alsobacter ponti]